MKLKITLAALCASTLFSGCLFDSEESKNNSETITGTSTVFAFTSDGTTGELRWLEGDSLSASSLEFHNDSKVIPQGNMLYILERYEADNLVILDASKLPSSESVKQIALKDASNPMDLVVVNDTLAWLALYNEGYVLAIDPSTGKAKDTLDISEYSSEGAPSPYTQALELYGDTLLVVLQRLNADWSVEKKGLVLVVDAISGKILDEIELKGRNPFDARVIGAQLYVGCQGSSMGTMVLDETHSLDVVDLKTAEVEVLVTSKNLGGAPTSIAYDAKKDLLYVGSYKAWGDMPVAIVERATGKILQKAIPNIYNAFGGIDVDPETSLLYIGDQDTEKGGLKTWDGDTTLTIQSGDALPIYSIAVGNW